MKIIVEKYIHARITPDTDQPPPYYRSPGDVLEATGIVSGREIDGNSLWYFIAAEQCFYWSGGMRETEEMFPAEVVSLLKEDVLTAVYKAAAGTLSGKYSTIEGYKGIAVGYKEKESRFLNELALVFYVSAKTPYGEGSIPEMIPFRGIPLRTDVRILRSVSLSWQNPADRSTPYLMGGSISDASPGSSIYGTRTAIVTRTEGGQSSEYLLTCYHVACSVRFAAGDNYSEQGKVITPDPGQAPGKQTVGGDIYKGEFNAEVDYALIKVDRPELLKTYTPEYQFTPEYKLGELTKELLEGTHFYKYGAATGDGSTRNFGAGKVLAFHVDEVYVDEALGKKMKGLIELSKISDKGDSGGPVVNETGKLLGYIIADNDDSSFVLPFATIAEKLSLTLKL